MGIHSDTINKIYKLAKKFTKGCVRNMSQVGEKYDPKKFGRVANKAVQG